MLETRQISWLKPIIITGFLLGMGSFQLLYAQGLSDYQVAPKAEVGVFSRDDGLAYIEALEFCLAQVGSPVKFNGQEREVIINELNRNLYTLPYEVQLRLTEARKGWDQYKASWNFLSRDEQIEFAYGVLALAYGEQAASQLLGLAPASGTGSFAPKKNYQEQRDWSCDNNPGLCP